MNKFDKLYFKALKGAAKEARTKSGGRIPSGERWGVKYKASKATTRRPWPIEGDHEKEILKGMARLAWADHWASRREERGLSVGGNAWDIAPKTNPAAKVWAKNVAAKFIRQEKAPNLTSLYNIVVEKYGYPNDPESFGADIAFEALGHGVNWRDRVKGHVPNDVLDIPYYTFDL